MQNIKLNLILFFIILLPFITLGQIKTRIIKAGALELHASTVDPEINEFFFLSGDMPTFPGGEDSLVSFALRNIKYPKTALRDSIEGSVMISFTVDSTGKVIDELIKVGVREDLDTICLSMLKKMPNWNPGSLRGTPVAVRFNIPIRFILRSKDEE